MSIVRSSAELPAEPDSATWSLSPLFWDMSRLARDAGFRGSVRMGYSHGRLVQVE